MLSECGVNLLMHLLAARWLQVAHGALHVGVPPPKLYGAQIDSCPQVPRGECRSEFVQPEVLLVQISALCDSFQAVKKVELRLAAGCGKHEIALLVSTSFASAESEHQLLRDRSLAFFVRLRSPAAIRLVTDTHRAAAVFTSVQ